ncbi:MAG: YqaA family protein [Candidatus Aenigmatarchaeota archaeon]
MLSLGFEQIVTSAAGWPGLGVVFVYSFLVAFILPTPSEVVLFAPLSLGVPYPLQLSLVIVISGLGKMAGSLIAFSVGQGFKRSERVRNTFKSDHFNIMKWSEKQAVNAAQKWGYFGLAFVLSIPFFPDTVTIYAFSILEGDYVKFALATFVGSVMRLVVTLGFIGGLFSLF